jgi:DtxR family Mn-dependent transcriptional regulator
MNDDLSATMRDYLSEIYRLYDRSDLKDGFVSTSALADVLDVSAPAVNRMITRLKETGFLVHEPYQGIRLTELGEREALKELRRHRIAEVFLVNVMGFGWYEVYDEALHMAGALSELIAARMVEMAENPTHCPHGEPIPTVQGEMSRPDDTLLSQAQEGAELVITRFRTREADRLEYIAALDLMPGKRLQVLHIAPFDGPMQLKVGKEYRIIGHNLAALIRVRPVEG